MKKFQLATKTNMQDPSFFQTSKINSQLYRMRDELTSLSIPKQEPGSQDHIISNRYKKQPKFKTFAHNFVNKNSMGLKKVLQQQRVKSIVRNFIIKLKRNLTFSNPVQYQPFQKEQDKSFLAMNGYPIPVKYEIVFSVFSIILILILCFIFPLQMVFQNFMEKQIILGFQIIAVLFYTIQIGVNLFTIKTVKRKKITNLRDILSNYLRQKFLIDLSCVLVLIIDLIFDVGFTRFLRLFVLIKIKECLQRLEKIQNMFINNFYKEQYLALVKVFLVNFCFAHILAVLLISISKLSEDNWLQKINVSRAPWYQQYTWAYYWGTTIMLTVGFGDISPTNYKQALCITIIQTFTCILLAYNINCVGNLINNIRQQNVEKQKNFKIVRGLVDQNNISQQLNLKVCNYIDQSDKMKKKFGFQSEKKFISSLPLQLKADFLKQSNIKIFQKLRFFSSFTEKTLLTLAEQIQVKIAHPEQIIFKSQSDSKFIILRDGKVGYCTKKSGCDFNGVPVDVIQLYKKDIPMVLHLSFITPSTYNQNKFQIKSMKYSIIYLISLLDFYGIIQNSVLDFESFCQMRDKSHHIVDQYEVIKCLQCPTKHSKMKCPKIHYIPIGQKVIFKYLQAVKIGKNIRKYGKWRKDKQIQYSPLKLREHFKSIQKQIYLGKTAKTMTRVKSYKFQQQKEELMIEQTRRNTTVHIKGTFDENRFINKIENRLLHKISQVIQQKEANLNQFFWDLECDKANNYKFYFTPFNSSELSIQIQTATHKNQQKQSKSKRFFNALKTMNMKTSKAL